HGQPEEPARAPVGGGLPGERVDEDGGLGARLPGDDAVAGAQPPRQVELGLAKLERHQSRSRIVPVPRPPPQHMVTSPSSRSERSSSWRIVVTSRAPVEPTGWPSAIAPPLTLTRSMSGDSSRCQ